MLGPSCKCIAVVHALLFTSVTATSSSTALNCLPGYYFDGKGCTKCTQCPLGYGLKNHCSDTEDTQCQPCIEGYDYSDTSGLDECILCDTYSNCLPGQSKIVKKCTVSSPPECDGCEDGYYIDKKVSACAKCSPPCRFNEEEVQKCLTQHDRICTPRSTHTDAVSTTSSTPITSTSSTSGNNSKDKVVSKSTKRQTVVTTKTADSSEVPRTEGSSREQKADQDKYLTIGISVGVAVVVLALLITFAIYKVCKGRRRKLIQLTQEEVPLEPIRQRNGTDRLVRDLSTEEKKLLIRELSGSELGYSHWKAVLDKLDDPGLREESRGWRDDKQATNINSFLETYEKKEGSTVKKLIKAMKDAGLEVPANSVQQKLCPDEVGASGNTTEVTYV